MENKNHHIDKEVQKTMDSIDQIERVEGNPFLYTRLQERLKQQGEAKVITTHSRIPVWQIAMVSILFLINGIVLQQSGYFESENSVASEDATLENFADEYALTKDEEDLDYLSLND